MYKISKTYSLNDFNVGYCDGVTGLLEFLYAVISPVFIIVVGELLSLSLSFDLKLCISSRMNLVRT